MKLSENWLREWVNPQATAAELAHKLNMAGLEAEAEPMLAVLPMFAQAAGGATVPQGPTPPWPHSKICV